MGGAGAAGGIMRRVGDGHVACEHPVMAGDGVAAAGDRDGVGVEAEWMRRPIATGCIE